MDDEAQAGKARVEWPAERIERRAIDALIANPLNAKTHTPEQIGLIRDSMEEWGWTMPVLIDERDVIIAGHGRVLAARQLHITEVPVVVARGWTDAQKRAYLIADNRLTEIGGDWDLAVLQSEIARLGQEGFDTSLIGFTEKDLADLRDGVELPTDLGLPRTLNESEQAKLDAAWRMLMREWDVFVAHALERGFFSNEFTKGALAVSFVRSLLFGEDIIRTATLPYTLHRLFQTSSRDVFAEVFGKAIHDDGLLHSVQWFCADTPSLRKMLSVTLGLHGHRYPFDFPALLARDLINEFCPDGTGRVLDPCHGWGGRLLGFMLAAHGADYVGYDVDEKTHQGVKAMWADLAPFVDNKDAAFLLQPFEDSQLEAASFDFAFTSPPYYDVEHYDGELQSFRRYPSLEEWIEGFYRPLLELTARALKPGALFALQIGSQTYPLREIALRIKPAAFTLIEVRNTDMVNMYTGTDPEVGEQLVILRRGNA